MKQKNKKRIKIIASLIIILLIILISIILLKRSNTNKIAEIQLAEEETELINLNLEVKEETNNSYKCLLTFTSNDENNKIKQIEYPTEEGKKPRVITVANEKGKEKVAVDYEITKKDEDKKFKLKTTDGKTHEKRTGYKITYKNDDEVFNVESRLLNQTISVTSLSPTQEGKHFIGYSKDKNSTQADYFKNGNYPEVNKDETLYAIYMQAKNGYTEEINNESILGKVSKINTSGVQNITVNGVTYSANIIVENNDLVLDGEKEVQGATLNNKVYEFGNNLQDVAKQNEDGTVENAQNMVILKVNGNLSINNNVTLTACKSEQGYGGPKGLFIYVTGTLTNNGTIDMTARGARAVGQDVYLWQNAEYEDENNKYEYVPAEGADGGSQTKKPESHNDGQNGIKRQTGGGGTGGTYWGTEHDGSYVPKGGNGTSYSGGSGGRS